MEQNNPDGAPAVNTDYFEKKLFSLLDTKREGSEAIFFLATSCKQDGKMEQNL